MANLTQERTYEQRRFLCEVKAICPESSAESVRKVIAMLQSDRKAQMGRLYLARQAQLHGTHLADWYVPRFMSEGWQPCAYLGAAFSDIPTVQHIETVRQRWFAHKHTLEGAIASSIAYQDGARATVGDVWPDALEPQPGFVTIVPPELIPLNEESHIALEAGRTQFHAVQQELHDTIAALRKAVEAFDSSMLLKQMFQAKRRSLLGTTLGRSQDAMRQLHAIWYRVQREIYAPALGLPNERPWLSVSSEFAQGAFAELVGAIHTIRTNLSYLKITV